MPSELVTGSELARRLNVSPQAVTKAANAGRLSKVDGKYDLSSALEQWDKNRARQRYDPDQVRRQPKPERQIKHQAQPAPPLARQPDPPPAAAERRGQEAVEKAAGEDYWAAKTRREVAEASIAELKEAEMRGDLVRRAVVEREFASRLVALRESLEVLADRLSAQVAAEADAGRCRQLLRDEHRLALAAFVERIDLDAARDEAQEDLDGIA